ncbi:MAG TPA: hypothetical protein DCL44_11705 [Elusimicrobia bacterium]|nr:hypothetical protein [Elusimicrobiota bacterium]
MSYLRGCILVLILTSFASSAFSAVGCDLNDPDRDVSRLFPSSTGYKTRYLSLKTSGGGQLLARVEERLGDKFKGLYENIDVPYTLYDIFRGTETLGYIHGVNQKGDYGGIQVFLALDARGIIKAFYIQKLTSRAAKELRSKEFGAQFERLALRDFENYPPLSGKITEGTALSKIKASPRAGKDFLNVMRAVKKNLILMDEFVFSKKEK